MTFAPGRDVRYRDYRGDGQLVLVMPQRVVCDGERGLFTWRPIGTPWLFRRTVDGRARRQIPFDQRHTIEWRLTALTWTGLHVLHLFRSGHAHSVWWMFNPDFTFHGWYVNLEAPPVRWDDISLAGVDTFDHALDVVVAPDRTWRWKDEGEFLHRAGHPAYWTAAQADVIRAEDQGHRSRRVPVRWHLVRLPAGPLLAAAHLARRGLGPVAIHHGRISSGRGIIRREHP